MNKCIRQSMRAILPVWRTTPIAALHRESGIPPITQLVSRASTQITRSLRVLAHIPTATRCHSLPPVATRTRLRRTDQQLPSCKRPVLLPHQFSREEEPLQTASREDSAFKFQQWLQDLPVLPRVVYSDDSPPEEGAAGYGCLKPVPAGALPTRAYLRRTAKQRSKDAFKAWWEESAPAKYRDRRLSATTSCLPELMLPRSTLHHLLAARSYHRDYAEYHERFEEASMSPQDRAEVQQRLQDERDVFDASRILFRELLARSQEEFVQKAALGGQAGSTTTSFSHQNTGFEAGIIHGNVSGQTFGGK
ncbi:hypothetical protein S40288_05990 [Stachybotrys chartarum IBT 40288]|nr:hypothetical protein S40288_05990 [Stachybotrys chartarum IBT 40288]